MTNQFLTNTEGLIATFIKQLKHSQKIIKAIQQMCSNIKPYHTSSKLVYPECDFSLSDFQKILVLCDDSLSGNSELKKLFVLYCYLVAYACKFTEYEPWVALQYQTQFYYYMII